MAWKHEKDGDIVINGFERGISDSPELGLGDIRSANITSVPGEVSASFSTVAGNIPPTGQTGVAYSAAITSNIVTVSSTSGYYPGMAIEIASTSLPLTVQALLVGGGGGGGPQATGIASGGGGGGAGAVIFNASVPVALGAYSVVTGSGGGGVVQSTDSTGGSGTVSSFNGISATGGGGGGGSGNGGTFVNINGVAGASGGGGGGLASPTPGHAGSGGSATNGNAGAAGAGNNASNYGSGGGGGGANTAGTAASVGAGGAGGNGVSTTIAGNITATYGGGGGGGGSSSLGTGGSGGGGAGGGSSATVNTGGGGGGGGATSGSGAVGRVQIAYLTGTLTATGGTITTNGAYTIHSFLTAATQTFTVTAVNPVVGNTYYIGNITGTTFKLYYDLALTQPVTWVANVTGTYDVRAFGTPVDKAYYQYYASPTSMPVLALFILDGDGNCWFFREQAVTNTGGTITAGSLQYAGNTGHSISGTNADFGIAAWQGYLFVIIGRNIDYIQISNLLGTSGVNGNWVYSWKTDLTYTQYQHQTISSARYDAVFICNASYVASLKRSVTAIAAGTAFDPTSSSTYTYTASALLLYDYDYAQSISQLGSAGLLVGGVLNYVYPWDGISSTFNDPLICADASMKRIITTNSNAYIFAGTRGRIYICNGQQIQLYKKIPDSLSGAPEPYYTWQDAIYTRNKLYFTITATDNAGNALSTMGGIWALGIDAGQTVIELPTAGSLFNSNQLSYGTYGGSAPVLFYSQLNTPPGYGIGAGWVNSGNGLDISSTAPYVGGQTYIDTDLIPVGTYYQPDTLQQLEYKLSKPLVAGEAVQVLWRGNLTDAFASVWTSSATGQMSDASQVNFQKQQWVQFRVKLTSTASSPSYTRLTELRLR